MARLFYPYKSLGDVLIVLVSPERKGVASSSKGEVTAVYDEEGGIVGYNLFSFSKKAKIKANGILFAPPAELKKIVSDEIANAGFPVPTFEENSGYVAAEVIRKEEHPVIEGAYIYTLDLGNGQATTVSSLKGIEEGEAVAVLESGYIGSDGRKFLSHKEKNIPIEALIVPEREFAEDGEENRARLLEDGVVAGSDLFA